MQNMCRWFITTSKDDLLYNYNLDEKSIVFDVGGHIGLFAERVNLKFNCNIYIFEPVEEFYINLVDKFSTSKNIKVYNFGLSGINKTEKIYITGGLGEGTSVYQRSEKFCEIRLVDVHEFLLKENIKRIDLFSMNIEGGEYDVLDRLIDKGDIRIINNLQIQFHDFFENAQQKRITQISKIHESHGDIYSFPFVWEAFIRK